MLNTIDFGDVLPLSFRRGVRGEVPGLNIPPNICVNILLKLIF
jgi:hypothetical protein